MLLLLEELLPAVLRHAGREAAHRGLIKVLIAGRMLLLRCCGAAASSGCD